MYKKVNADLNFKDRELETIKFWQENEIFKKSLGHRKDGEVFTFYDGPPTANGKPHIGHILTRVVKDIIPRYKTMKGYNVLRKAGWDTHGLPVELEVEKMLGISGKPQIEEYGVEPFIEKCKESVWKYEKEWKEMSERVGFWADMEEPYVTYHDNYIESIWWALKTMWDKDLIYKGHKIVPYCPRCGTSLSSHEVAQGYKDVKEKSVIAKFKVVQNAEKVADCLKDSGEITENILQNCYILAWTTTPWTLPSNTGLCVNPDDVYMLVKTKKDGINEYLILAEALADSVFGNFDEKSGYEVDEMGRIVYEVVKTFIGKELNKTYYEPLFGDDMLDLSKHIKENKQHFVVSDHYVTLTDGTGIVHIAPAFGEDDARVGRENDLPFLQFVDEQGNLTEELLEWKGIFVKDADKHIIKYLKSKNTAFKVPNYEHSYPFCWRCDTPLIYYARSSWFIKMSSLREKLLKNNDTINWLPDNIKDGRFGNFLENVIDWGISRERYWGTPLPIWVCEDSLCEHKQMIGSRQDLQNSCCNKEEISNLDEIELHKHTLDKVKIKCEKCGKPMTRVTEVIDCWFDSGSMPFAQWHYPFENKEMFESHYPADFISEAVDQTRGWFYTLVAISTAVFDKAPFKNCIVLGHVQDENGQKMSKHKGNVVNPWDVLDKQGADAVRWYFMTNSAPWLPNRFSEDNVNEYQRKFMGTLWNTYAFYVLYAEIDNFNPMDYKLEIDKLSVMDKWIISKLNSLIDSVDKDLQQYKLTEPTRAITEFVDELSNWYVRRCRTRFWASGMEQDKINAYMTLNHVLVTLTKLIAPFVPFMAEDIYDNLVKSVDENALESVHFCDYPQADENLIDEKLEEQMKAVLDIVVLGRSGRNNSNIKNRQPIGNMFVNSKITLENSYIEIISEELNVKKCEFVDDVSELTSYSFKPQMKTVGPKYGKLLGKIGGYLKENDGNKLMNELNNGGIKFEVDGTSVLLEEADVLVEMAQKDGYVAEKNKGVTVVLDTNLTEELLEEGFVREIISKVQTMRKEAGFEVQDKINLAIIDNSKLNSIVDKFKESICSDVLAENVSSNSIGGFAKDWNINGEKAKFEVKKI